jgi:hypothetical protein
VRVLLNIQGLRSSDGLTLSILCQDVVRQPLVEIAPVTVCDLLQLAVTDGLPAQLQQDLDRFAPQMVREIGDLPDTLFPGFMKDIEKVPAEHVPATVRRAVSTRAEAGKSVPKIVAAWDELLPFWEGSEVETIQLGGATSHVKVKEYDVPDSHKAPDERKHKPRARKKSAADGDATTDAPGAVKSPRAAAKDSFTARMRNPQRPVRDPARASWLRKALLERLGNASGGIKQALLVAGMLRRSEWADMAPDEVVTALRSLDKEGRVKLSAGRWSKLGR